MSNPTAGEEIEPTVFQKVLTDFQTKNQLNAIITIANSKPLFSAKVGFLNLATSQPFSEDSLFPIASISKQFIAVAILLLMERKQLDLHDPIINYLPSNHAIWQGRAPQWADQVTIHHLLTHSSGIFNCTNEDLYQNGLNENIDKINDQDILPWIISLVKDHTLRFLPGKGFEYTNTGYLLLSVIIQELSAEKNLESFLKIHLFSPLGMEQTYLPHLNEERAAIHNFNHDKNLPIRYIGNLEDPVKQPIPMHKMYLKIPLAGAGAIISTTRDLLKWNQALYQGTLLSPASLRLMTTVHITGNDPYFGGELCYGYGIFIKTIDQNEIIYHHGGWLQGARAELSYAPHHNTSVVCLSNLSPDETQTETAQVRQILAFQTLAMTLQYIAMGIA